MKTYRIIFLLLLCIFFLLTACSGKEKKTDERSETTGVTETITTTMATEKETQEQEKQEEKNMKQTNFYITAGDTTFTAVFADNSSADAFRNLLAGAPLTISMKDYGSFEKVGEIGQTLPTNDEQITTEPGDVILYLGSSVTIYYDTNSWNFTRLGKIENATKDGLLSALGKGNVTVTFSLSKPQ